MQLRNLLAFAVLALSPIEAAPGIERYDLAKRAGATCNADNCLRAVRASSVKPGPSSATADCSSFMAKTVTLCPSVTYITVTSTFTKSPVTVTGTLTTVQGVPLTSVTSQISPVTTLEATALATVPVTSVVVNTVVVTSVTTVTKTSGALQKRANDSCSINATGSATAVPTYASACAGSVRYSSACSCAGITGTTSTLPRQTSTSTVTSTVTVTPTVTATALRTVSSSTTVVSTRFIPTTIVTTDVTATVLAPVTSVTSVTVTTVVTQTLTVTPSRCSTFIAQVSGGAHDGSFAFENQDVYVGATNASADKFVLQSDGRVNGPYDKTSAWWSRIVEPYRGSPIREVSDCNGDNCLYMKCSFSNPDGDGVGLVQGAASLGQLQCSYGGTSLDWADCEFGDGHKYLYTMDETYSGDRSFDQYCRFGLKVFVYPAC